MKSHRIVDVRTLLLALPLLGLVLAAAAIGFPSDRPAPRALAVCEAANAQCAGEPSAVREADEQAVPTLGMVIFGISPAGTVDGQEITARIVGESGTITNCGGGKVIDDDGLKFVVRVRSSSFFVGCGEDGTAVSLFFHPAPGSGGGNGLPVTPWEVGPKQVSIGLGAPPRYRAIAIQAANSGIAGTGPAPSPTPGQTATVTPTAITTPTVIPSPAPATATPVLCGNATAEISALNKHSQPESVTISGSGILSGWYIISENGNQRFDFPARFVLDGSVEVLSGPGAFSNPPATLFWTDAHQWNNDLDDDASLFDCQDTLRSSFEDGD